MKLECLLFLAVTTLLLVAGGCATRVERDFGNSFNQAKDNQILNKEAVKNPDPVTGLDGKAADTVMSEYRKSFTVEGRKAKTSGLVGGDEKEGKPR